MDRPLKVSNSTKLLFEIADRYLKVAAGFDEEWRTLEGITRSRWACLHRRRAPSLFVISITITAGGATSALHSFTSGSAFEEQTAAACYSDRSAGTETSAKIISLSTCTGVGDKVLLKLDIAFANAVENWNKTFRRALRPLSECGTISKLLTWNIRFNNRTILITYADLLYS